MSVSPARGLTGRCRESADTINSHEGADDYLRASAERFGDGCQDEGPDAEHGEVRERARLEDVRGHAWVVLTEATARCAVGLRERGSGEGQLLGVRGGPERLATRTDALKAEQYVTYMASASAEQRKGSARARGSFGTSAAHRGSASSDSSPLPGPAAVSYTHLTLPTIYSV